MNKTTNDMLDDMIKVYLLELCISNKTKDNVREYRVDGQNLTEPAIVLRGYPVWMAGVCKEWEIMYRLLKQGYGFQQRIEENILEITDLRYEWVRSVDYERFKNVFLSQIFEDKFLEHYFIEKADDATGEICRKLENYIFLESTDLWEFHETMKRLSTEAGKKKESLVYAAYMPDFMKWIEPGCF